MIQTDQNVSNQTCDVQFDKEITIFFTFTVGVDKVDDTFDLGTKCDAPNQHGSGSARFVPCAFFLANSGMKSGNRYSRQQTTRVSTR